MFLKVVVLDVDVVFKVEIAVRFRPRDRDWLVMLCLRGSIGRWYWGETVSVDINRGYLNYTPLKYKRLGPPWVASRLTSFKQYTGQSRRNSETDLRG